MKRKGGFTALLVCWDCIMLYPKLRFALYFFSATISITSGVNFGIAATITEAIEDKNNMVLGRDLSKNDLTLTENGNWGLCEKDLQCDKKNLGPYSDLVVADKSKNTISLISDNTNNDVEFPKGTTIDRVDQERGLDKPSMFTVKAMNADMKEVTISIIAASDVTTDDKDG